jgi:uncharacterized repeat protein (TIGR03803 family)
MKAAFAVVICVAAAFTPVSAARATTYQETVLYSFDDMLGGWQPYAGVVADGDHLYGTANAGGNTDSGMLFSLSLRAHKEKGLYSFDSEDGYPNGALIKMNGLLYGTTTGVDGFGGLVFSFDPGTKTVSSVYGFCRQANCADGAYPSAALTAVKGIFYGTTLGGGIAGCDELGCGTVFSLDPNTHTEKVLHAFCSEQNCADGRWPDASLIEMNGHLYGTATFGAVPGCDEEAGCGVVFSINRKTGKEKVLYSFCSQMNCADGANPYAGLTKLGGMLYGTTGYGGNSGCGGGGCGTVFSIDPKTGAEKVIYAFCGQQNCTDGAQPHAALIAANGLLYGTTIVGGAGCSGEGCGTVFSLDPNTGIEMVLYAFGDKPDGQFPTGLIDVNGTFYGTTIFGGNTGNGVVFALTPQ